MMKTIVLKISNRIFFIVLFICFITTSCTQDNLEVDDVEGVLGKTNAPISVEIMLTKPQMDAAVEGRLGIIDVSAANRDRTMIPVQLETVGNGGASKIVFVMPDGGPGSRRFRLAVSNHPLNVHLDAFKDPGTGQITLTENGRQILQYNYQTIYEKDVIRGGFEKLERHVRSETDTFVTTSIYAVPRSNYIHPLFGLEGEMLTRDWPEGDHPHHRGIYWAWPEVVYESEFGDLHALQKVFARPTGQLEYLIGPVFSQVLAENLWMWKDSEPIVREYVLIRSYAATSTSRTIDLAFEFIALKDDITLATRGKNSYGGLNIRMQTPESQEISYQIEENDSNTPRAWSDLSGLFEELESPTGLMVLQHQDNPDYPGIWVEYPDLSWVQPTFPAQGTRYPLKKGEPLTLRYRLIVHKGGKPDVEISRRRWDAFNGSLSPILKFHHGHYIQ